MQVVGDAVGQEGLALAGRGLADTTRLASSPPDIWQDIAATNADEIGPALDALIALLQDLRRDLPEGERLSEVFTEAARWRASAQALRLMLGAGVDAVVPTRTPIPVTLRSRKSEQEIRRPGGLSRETIRRGGLLRRPTVTAGSDRYTNRFFVHARFVYRSDSGRVRREAAPRRIDFRRQAS